MSWFSGLKSFVSGTKAKSADVNENFNLISAALNSLFKADTVSATGPLNLTGSFQDIPGAALAITPDQPSLLLVWANWEFHLAGPTVNCEAVGVLTLDGADQPRRANFTGITVDAGVGGSMASIVAQSYCLPLSEAAHTVKLRAYKEGAAASALQGHTGFSYLLIPDPEP